jgi:hypothetical protein
MVRVILDDRGSLDDRQANLRSIAAHPAKARDTFAGLAEALRDKSIRLAGASRRRAGTPRR